MLNRFRLPWIEANVCLVCFLPAAGKNRFRRYMPLRKSEGSPPSYQFPCDLPHGVLTDTTCWRRPDRPKSEILQARTLFFKFERSPDGAVRTCSRTGSPDLDSVQARGMRAEGE